MSGNKFLDTYMEYVEDSECPAQFNRWSLITAVSAAIQKKLYFTMSTWRVYSHFYTVLIGLPATRKNTAIRFSKQLLTKADFKKFAPRSSREKFLQDFSLGFDNVTMSDQDVLENFDNVTWDDEHSCGFICEGELLDFFGISNRSFLTTITNIWDASDGDYFERTKKGEVKITSPYLCMLGGATPQNLSQIMPKDCKDHGILSRLIIVYCDPTPKKVAFPEPPDPKIQEYLVNQFKEITKLSGEVTIDPDAKKFLKKIYETYSPLLDSRLQGYNGRRFDHLLKLCVVLAACRLVKVIDTDIVEEANTILSHTEQGIPRALGDMADGKFSIVAQRILDLLSQTVRPMNFESLWEAVGGELERPTALQEILLNLEKAGKLSNANEGAAYILNRSNKADKLFGVNVERWIHEAK